MYLLTELLLVLLVYKLAGTVVRSCNGSSSASVLVVREVVACIKVVGVVLVIVLVVLVVVVAI